MQLSLVNNATLTQHGRGANIYRLQISASDTGALPAPLAAFSLAIATDTITITNDSDRSLHSVKLVASLGPVLAGLTTVVGTTTIVMSDTVSDTILEFEVSPLPEQFVA